MQVKCAHSLITAIVAAAVAILAVSSCQAQWTPAVNVSNTSSLWDTDVSYDFDSSGNIHAVWLTDWQHIYYANNVGGVWSKVLLASQADYPLLCITPDQVIHVFYSGKSSDIGYEITKPVSGGSWSAPLALTADTNGTGMPWDVVVDSTGGIYFGWYHLFDATLSPNRSAAWGRYKPLGGSWGPTELIIGTNHEDNWPMNMYLAALGTKIYCGYSMTGTSTKYDCTYKVRENGVWGAQRTVPYEGGAPAFAVSPLGELACAYARDTGDNPGGLSWEVFVAFSSDGGNAWSPEYQVSDSNWLARGPVGAVYDANGNFHCAWQQKFDDYDDFDMWYRARIGGVWQSRANLTNSPNGKFTGSPEHALKALGNDVHLFFGDNDTNILPDGTGECYYIMKTGPQDHTPPAAPATLTAIPGDNRVHVAWQNPADSDYVATMVRVSTSGYPAGPFANTLVCLTTASPGSQDSFLAYPLAANVRHYFSAFAQDASGNWSVAAQADTTPLQDVTPPGPVASFTAVPNTTADIRLSWTNPSDIDFKGTAIYYRTDQFPTGHGDGLATEVGLFPNTPGSAASTVHSGLPPGVTYYYAAFAYDQETSPNYSVGAFASTSPMMQNCGYLKRQADGWPVDAPGLVVSAIFPSDPCLYVQDAGRTGGIRVASDGAGLAVGDVVRLKGTLSTRLLNGTTKAEREVTNAELTKTSSGPSPKPLGMNGLSIGGTAIPPYLPGVRDGANPPRYGAGLNNMGLLVTTAGKVALKITSYLYVDDGSGIADVSGRTGIMVRCPDVSIPASVGDFVCVTGIVEGSVPAGWDANRRLVRLRTYDDLVVCTSGGSISGTVTDAWGAAIADAVVATDPGGYSAATLGDGSYTIQGVAAGTYDVTASATGYTSQTQAGIAVASGQTAAASFALASGKGKISGYVRDMSSNPISGATVSAGGYSATTSSSGAYAITGVTPGAYSITASKTGWTSQTQAGIVVTADQTRTVDFSLTSSTGTISGYVRDNLSNSISGATVSTNSGGYATTSGSNGAYTLSGVQPGSYSVTATKSGYSPQTNGVTVTAGQTTTTSFNLIPLVGSITGYVRDTNNNAVSGATVSTSTGGYSTTSAADGSYALSNVVPGTYSVTASKTGYTSQTKTGIVVVGNQATACDFSILYTPIVEKLLNGGFEGGFFNSGWYGGYCANGWGFAWKGSPAENSFYCNSFNAGSPHNTVHLVQGKVNNFEVGIAQEISGLTVGAGYTFSAQSYKTGGSYETYIAVRPGVGYNSQMGTTTGTTFPSTTGSWVSQQVTGTVGSTGSVTVYLWVKRLSGSTADIHFDNASFMSW